MLPQVLAHDPDTASDHVFLLFYVAGFHTAQDSKAVGDSFPVLVFEGTTQTAHISPPYVALFYNKKKNLLLQMSHRFFPEI